jgi:cardiolipin synthase
MQSATASRLMQRLKRVSRTVGAIIVGIFALIGLMSLTRGTPLRHVLFDKSPPQVADSNFRQLASLFTGIDLQPRHRVEQLLNGDGTYPRLWSDLRAARQTITIQNYYSKPGAVADTLAAILAERARAGVRVLLLLDAFGSQSLKKSWAERLERAGVQVALLRKVKWYSIYKATDRSHVRAFVIDGTIGYTGGFGLADYWLGDGRTKDQWRETNVRFEGPAVLHLQATFAAGWVEATGRLLTDEVFFPRSAGHAPPGTIAASLLFMTPTSGSTTAERFLALTIAASARTLFITNSYFVPDDDFRTLLIDAVKRGVDVRVLTASHESDVLITWYGGRGRYERLLRGGVRIFEYQPTMIHGKTIIADGIWGTIGTMNFDNRSLAFNDESNLVIWDGGFGALMDSTFAADLRLSREITLAEFQKRPMVARMVELAASALQRLL